MRYPRTAAVTLAASLALVLGAASCGTSDRQTVGVRGSADPPASTTIGGSPGSTPGTPGSSTGGGAGSSPGSPGDPSGVVSTSVPGTGGTLPGQRPTEVPNRHDLVSPHVSDPNSTVVDDHDPTLVHVRFWGGIPSCTGAEVTVQESATTVVVTLRTGGVPGPKVACPDIAEYEQVSVHLKGPLGTRALLTTQG